MELDGVAPAEIMTEQPRLPVGLLTYLEAFYELDTERSHTVTAHGMSVARIPWSRIVAYGMHYGHDIEELVFFIRKMDDAHLERLAGGMNGGSTGPGEVVQRPPRPD